MRKLRVRPQARLDLLDIWNHIARDDVQAANRVGDRIDDAILGLVRMPGKGHSRSDVKKNGYRSWKVYSYVIAYEYDDEHLTVVRVVHGRRDFRRLFKGM